MKEIVIVNNEGQQRKVSEPEGVVTSSGHRIVRRIRDNSEPDVLELFDIGNKIATLKNTITKLKESGVYGVIGDMAIFNNINISMNPSLYLVGVSYTAITEIYTEHGCIGCREQPMIKSFLIFDTNNIDVVDISNRVRCNIGSMKNMSLISISQLV